MAAALRDLASLVVFGVLLAGMNTAFYEAIDRLPLGVAVTIEFLGPLTVATIFSRRRAGSALDRARGSGRRRLRRHPRRRRARPRGYRVRVPRRAACWGTYVLVAKRVGRTWAGSEGLAAAMVVAALALAPFGIVSGGVKLVDPVLLLLAAGVGVFSAAIPFALELHALRRLTATSYGVLTSLEPAVAGAAGLVLLGQRPGLPAIVAALLVVTASIGVTRSASAQ